MKLYYQAKEAANLISFTSSDIARLGQVISPDIPANGRGYKSFYSFKNLVEMRLGNDLAHLGIPWKRICRYVEALRKSHGRWLEKDGLDGWLVLDRDWQWGAGTTLDTAMAIVFKDRPQDLVIAINIGIIKQGIRSKDRGGDTLTDEEFDETMKTVETASLLRYKSEQ